MRMMAVSRVGLSVGQESQSLPKGPHLTIYALLAVPTQTRAVEL